MIAAPSAAKTAPRRRRSGGGGVALATLAMMAPRRRQSGSGSGSGGDALAALLLLLLAATASAAPAAAADATTAAGAGAASAGAAATGANGAGAGGVVRRTTAAGNLRADVLVLDAGSLSFQGNHPIAPPVVSADGCERACAATPGCTAWTFCGSKGGCGSGCAAYVREHPRLATAASANPTLPNPAWSSLPAILGFGPHGLTAGCTGDAFPFGMCSLKKLPAATAAAPEFWSRGGDGFASGWFAVPQACPAGVAVGTCERCLASANPTSCLACASSGSLKQTALQAITGGAALGGRLSPADGCSSCASSATAAAAASCMACLVEGGGSKPCARCALQPPGAPGGERFDVDGCVACHSRLGGERFGESCLQCARLGASPAAQARCMACVERLASKGAACAPGAPSGLDSGCWNPSSTGASLCHACATSAADYEACVRCGERRPYTESCWGCAALQGGGAAAQAACFNCTRAAASASTGCSDCANYLGGDSRGVELCYACLASPATTAEGKRWCFACQNWCAAGGDGARAGCAKCLTVQRSDYPSACACK